jgi:type I restriction enzyme M protein
MSAFDYMKKVGGNGSTFSKYMKEATFMIPNARLLDKTVQMIDQIDMQDRDTKGDLYEYLLSKLQTSGQNGQFRTPRHIIRMMVNMAKPGTEDTICDPAAGTAGFLVAADEYLRSSHPEAFHQKTFREFHNSDMFTGIEFDATMRRIGAMNMLLHGIEQPKLIAEDALSEDNGDIEDQFSLILANPPFKGSLDYDIVDNKILNIVKSKSTELLFLGLMLRMLKPGGRCAVIVPNGVLFGSSKAHIQIRKEIIENHQLQAVVSMPSGVFKPYAGVSTAVLLFTKTNSGGTDNVWFYEMKADGKSLDDNRADLITPEQFEQVFTESEKVADDLQGICDIADVLKRYHKPEEEAKRERTENSFFVPKKELQENDYDLSINRYKEIVYEEVEYDSPDEIINGKEDEKGIRQLSEERLNLLNELEELLK